MKTLRKTILSILLLTLFLITISSANAAENTTDLGDLITNTPNNSGINLEEGTYRNNTTDIIINKNLTIIGKGADKTIIDAENLGQIFYITEGNTLTLINITLTNGRANNGGAIYNEGGTLTAKNCIFSNNNVMHYGGAIYTSGEINIINSTFINNEAISNGGAISTTYSDNIVTYYIINSTLINNTGVMGGAIHNDNDNYMIINNSVFINNTAHAHGGAISNYGNNLTIDNSVFTNNNVIYNDGGAIFTIGIILVKNSNFNNNQAMDGGAISTYTNCSIENSTFSNNKAEANGGAIYNPNEDSTINIKNSNFIYNSAINGGAIFNSYGVLNILGSIFKKNNATDGGAIYNGGNLIINYSIIVDNTDENNYAIKNYGTICDVEFNWWGSNDNPYLKTNAIINNYYNMFLNTTPLNNTLEIGDVLNYNYYFVLNGTNDNAGAHLYFPYFEVDIYKNGVLIDKIDGRKSQTLNTVLNSKVSNFSTTLDYETQEFTILATEPIPPIPPVPPEPPIPPIPPIPPEPNNNTNNTSKNPVASATMKETGIPINLILIILLSLIGLVAYRKK
jgi:predicted outer membrane repeat protein